MLWPGQAPRVEMAYHCVLEICGVPFISFLLLAIAFVDQPGHSPTVTETTIGDVFCKVKNVAEGSIDVCQKSVHLPIVKSTPLSPLGGPRLFARSGVPRYLRARHIFSHSFAFLCCKI